LLGKTKMEYVLLHIILPRNCCAVPTGFYGFLAARVSFNDVRSYLCPGRKTTPFVIKEKVP